MSTKGVGLTALSNPIYNRLDSNINPRNLGWYMRAMGQKLDYNGDEEFFVLDPPYQRANVWTKEQAQKFVGFILEGGVSPAIYLRELTGYGYEVIDGKQRLTALFDFFEGRIFADVYGISTEIWFKDFNNLENRFFRNGITIPGAIIKQANEVEIMELYLRLNRGGTPHTQSEIENVENLLKKAVK